MSNQRVQRMRTRGWRMPANTVYVGRPSKWGNPFRVGEILYPNGDGSAIAYAQDRGWSNQVITPAMALDLYRWWLDDCLWYRLDEPLPLGSGLRHLDLSELAGKDLACWCRLDAPCHADVLLQIIRGTG